MPVTFKASDRTFKRQTAHAKKGLLQSCIDWATRVLLCLKHPAPPAPVLASSCKIWDQRFEGAQTAEQLFHSSVDEDIRRRCRKIIQSSFFSDDASDIRTSYVAEQATTNLAASTVEAVKGGLFDIIYVAYSTHRNLILKPDDVWLAILRQFSIYVNANTEKLRHLFVAHKGKKRLVVERQSSIDTVDFGDVSIAMADAINNSIVDPSLRDWIMPSFSTTTENDRIVTAITMMDTLQKYFDYYSPITCGIPQVTLLGEKADWEALLKKIDKLGAYGDDTAAWAAMLTAILKQFVAAFDNPSSKEVYEFWRKVVTSDYEDCDGHKVTGWLTAFIYFNQAGYSPNSYDYFGDINKIDGVLFPVVDLEKRNTVPDGYGKVPLTVNDNGMIINTWMIAGIVGKKYHENEEGICDTVSPVSGWWMIDVGPTA